MSASGRRALPALVIAVTLGIGILIGTVVSHGVHAAKAVGRVSNLEVKVKNENFSGRIIP